MATTSTIPTLKAAIIATLDARAGLNGVHVVYAWDGPAMEGESVFLDPPDTTQPGRSQIPTLKAGRKAREETFTVVLVVQVAQAGGTADTAATTEARAYAILAEAENTFADDPGLAAVVGPTGRFILGDHTRTLTAFEKGWVSRLEQNIECAVRLS